VIPLVKSFMPDQSRLMPELQKILYSGYIAQGAQVEKFEQAFEEFVGSGHSLTVNSGTAALHIALILAGVEENDEVISTALTAEPTNIAIKMLRAKIRYADVDYNTGCVDPDSIEICINEKTKAIVVVDYAGIPVNVKQIQLLSEKYDIPVIHDAAHSLGSKFNGENVGTHFPYTAFSFQAIKQMTTVDGGILQIKNTEEYQRGKLLRWFGIDKSIDRLENNIDSLGFKYHMNNVNATIGLVQLETIESITKKSVDNGRYYDDALMGNPDVDLIKYYENSEPAFWLYTMKVENRTDFIEAMAAKGISASQLHKRNDLHSFLNDFKDDLPSLDIFYEKMVHIPCGWWVSEEDRSVITDAIQCGW